MCPGCSVYMNRQQTNGSESPRRYIIIVSRGNNQTNFSDDGSKPGTLFLSVAGHCHNMASKFCITHPIKMFSLNFVNYSLIIRSNPSLFLLTYLIAIQYKNNCQYKKTCNMEKKESNLFTFRIFAYISTLCL